MLLIFLPHILQYFGCLTNLLFFFFNVSDNLRLDYSECFLELAQLLQQ